MRATIGSIIIFLLVGSVLFVGGLLIGFYASNPTPLTSVQKYGKFEPSKPLVHTAPILELAGKAEFVLENLSGQSLDVNFINPLVIYYPFAHPCSQSSRPLTGCPMHSRALTSRGPSGVVFQRIDVCSKHGAPRKIAPPGEICKSTTCLHSPAGGTYCDAGLWHQLGNASCDSVVVPARSTTTLHCNLAVKTSTLGFGAALRSDCCDLGGIRVGILFESIQLRTTLVSVMHFQGPYTLNVLCSS